MECFVSGLGATQNDALSRKGSDVAAGNRRNAGLVAMRDEAGSHETAPARISRRAVLSNAVAVCASALVLESMPAIAASVTDKTKGNQLLRSLGLEEQNVPSGFGLIVTKIKPDAVVSFVHPSGWLLNEEVDLAIDRPRLDKSRPKGKSIVRAAEYRKAEEVGVFLDDAGSASTVEDVSNRTLLDILTGEGATDAKIISRVALEPNRQLITGKFVTVTDAAYAFDRRLIAVATVVGGRLFICAGEATDKRYKKSTGALLETSVRSFQVAKGVLI